MNWLDIVLVVVLAVSVLVGLRGGLIKVVLSLAGLVIGIVLAGRYYVALSHRLTFIESPKIAEIVAFAIILVAILIATAIVVRLLNWVASLVMLAWLNRLAGAIFGLLIGALVCGAALALWAKYFGLSRPLADSAIAAMLLERFPIILKLLPSEFGGIRSFF